MSTGAPLGLFDLEPHGTPCMVCGDLACTCRLAGTLEVSTAAPAYRLAATFRGWVVIDQEARVVAALSASDRTTAALEASDRGFEVTR